METQEKYEHPFQEKGVRYNQFLVPAIKGFDYELRVLTLLALRCLRNGWPFHVATNARDFFPFDDIVLAYDDGTVGRVCAIQVKHSSSGKVISTTELTRTDRKHKDFSLVYYCRELAMFYQQRKNQVYEFCRNIGFDFRNTNIQYCLYTNRTVQSELASPLKDWFCNIFGCDGSTLKFDAGSEIFQKVQTLVKDESPTIMDILGNFSMLFGQANNCEITVLVEEELQRYFLISKSRVSEILKTLLFDIKTWCYSESCITLTQNHPVFERLFSSAYQDLKISFHSVLHFREEVVQKCIDQLQTNRGLVSEVSLEEGWPLIVMLLQQAFDRVLTVFSDALCKRWPAVKAAWTSAWYDKLVVILTGSEWFEEKVRAFLEQHRTKKIFLIGNMPKVPTDFLQIEITISFDQLNSESQKIILSRSLNFQGHDMEFSQVFNYCDSRYLTVQSIWEILQDKNPRIGSILSEPSCYYIPRRFSKENCTSIRENELLQCGSKVMISGSAGLGKTVLLNSLAHEIKKQNPHLWVIPINFRDYLDSLLMEDAANKILFSAACHDGPYSSIQKDLFRSYSTTGHFAVLIDAFDEIHPHFTETCLKSCKEIVKIISKTGFFCIATRPVCATFLKQLEGLQEFKMCPFSDDDLSEFFIKNLSVAGPNSYYEIIAKDFLNFLQAPENMFIRDFIGIPLQAKMLVECATLNEGKVIGFPKYMTVNFLFKRFIYKMIDRHMEEKLKLSDKNPLHFYSMKALRDRQYSSHQLLALFHIFPPDVLSSLGDNIRHKGEQLLDNFEETCQQTGIVLLDEKNQLTFLHQTFAEFLAATWLKENVQRQFITKYYSEKYLSQTWNFFDLLFVGKRKLHTAALMGNERRVQDLLQTPKDGAEADDAGRTPLHLAVIGAGRRMRGCMVLRLLLERNCDPNVQDMMLQWTPLQYADYFMSYEAMEQLLQHGATPTGLKYILQDPLALHCAAMGGHTCTMEVLLKLGVPVDGDGKGESTPLHRAAEGGHWQCVRLLLDAAQSRGRLQSVVAARDSEGNTPLDCTVDERCFVLLWQHGSPRQFPLHRAAELGLVEAMKVLLASGIPLELMDKSGRSPLHCACWMGHEETVQLLLERGASMEARDLQGRTPLHCATESGSVHCARLLMEAAQRVGRLQHLLNARDNCKRRPLEMSKDQTMALLLHPTGDADQEPDTNFDSSAMRLTKIWSETQGLRANKNFELISQLVAVVAVRCFRRGWSFYVTTDAEVFHPFDDLVIVCMDRGLSHLWALKLHYQSHGHSITTCDLAGKRRKETKFSLPYYYRALRQKKKERKKKVQGFCEKLGLKYDNFTIKYGIYTNLHIDSHEFYDQSIPSSSLIFSNGYQASKDLLMKALQDTIQDDEPTIEYFLDRFCLFNAQKNIEETAELIKSEIRINFEISGARLEDVFFNLSVGITGLCRNNEITISDNNSIFQVFFTAVTNDLIISQESKVHFQDQCVHVFRDAVSNMGQRFFLFSTGDEWQMHMMLFQQTLIKVLAVTVETLDARWRLVKIAWASFWYDILLVRVTGTAWQHSDMEAFLDNNPQKKVILLGFLPAIPYRYVTLDRPITYGDLSEDCQDMMMHREISFQGHSLNLRELLKNDTANLFMYSLNSECLWQLLQSKNVSVGCNIEEPHKIYVSRRFKVKDPHISYISEDRLLEIKHMGVVIGDPGIGKTELLRSLARNSRQKNPLHWIVPINFRHHIDLIKNDDSMEQILNQAACAHSHSSVIETSIFEYFKKSGHLAIFIDAFDEITPLYTERCLTICQAMKKIVSNKGFFWIATRSVCFEHINNTLDLPAFSICKFSYTELNCFIERFLASSQQCHENWGQIKHNVEKVEEVIGIPLHANILMKCVCESGDLILNQNMTIGSIYKLFIDKSIYRLLEEKLGLSVNDPLQKQLVDLTHEATIRNHQLLAAHHVFSAEIIKELDRNFERKIKAALGKFEEVNQRVGLVTNLHGGNLTFLHQTFAEYLAATWLADHIKKDFVVKYYSELHLFPTWDFMDQLFIGDRRLHSAALQGNMDTVRERLLQPEDANEQDDQGRTPLHLAVIGLARVGRWGQRDYEVVELLLDSGSDANIKDSLLEWSPLRYADCFEDYGSLELLLRHGVCDRNLEKLPQDQFSLHRAARLGLLNTMQALMDCGMAVDVRNEDGKTPLHMACTWGSEQSVRLLLERGADASARDNQQMTPAHCASRAEHHECLRIMLEAEQKLRKTQTGKLNSTQKQDADRKADEECAIMLFRHGATGKLPLHQAAQFGFMEAVAALLNKGFPVNYRNCSGETPLHWACRGEKEHVVQLLLARGADIAATDQAGRTALHWACSKGHEGCAKLLLGTAHRTGTVGGIINATDNQGQSSLDCVSTKRCASLLLKHGGTGLYALHKAAVFGIVDGLADLLDSGLALDARDQEGATALHCACSEGKEDAVRLLLDRGADIAASDSSGRTSLHCASSNARVRCVALLLGAAKRLDIALDFVHARDKEGRTALDCTIGESCASLLLPYESSKEESMLLAASFGLLDKIENLLDFGVSVNCQNINNETPLHRACIGMKEESVQILLSRRADIQAKEYRGRTALHWASSKGHRGCIKLLLDEAKKLDCLTDIINNRDILGQTPLDCTLNRTCSQLLLLHGGTGQLSLHLAARFGLVESLNSLLGMQLSVDSKNINKETPLHWACMGKKDECVELLLKRGADISASDCKGITALHWASSKGNEKCLKILLEAAQKMGKNIVNATNFEGQTPLDCVCDSACAEVLLQHGGTGANSLHQASLFGLDNMIEILLNSGVSVNSRNAKAETPLQWACMGAREQTMKLLLHRGADICTTDERGRTALHTASSLGHAGCVKLLLEEAERLHCLHNLVNKTDKHDQTPLDCAGES